MPYKASWESTESVRVEFFGELTFNDTLCATEDLYNDPRSDFVRNVFWDFSAITGFVVSEAEVTDMAAMDHAASLYMHPLKAAFIIRDPGLMQLGEQYVAMLSDMGCSWHNKLFTSMHDARQWAAV
jgi:hypothetical protein